MSPRGPAEGVPAGSAAGSSRLETWLCAAIGLAAGLFYMGSAAWPGPWTAATREPQGYCALEAAGFRSGHLYLPVQPRAELLALADPYDPAANTPYRVHDMSLYKGRYYLYFGAAPAVLLFWPAAALTGRYPTDAFAVTLFCAGSLWIGMGLLLAIRRRYFPGAPLAALLAGWISLIWASPQLRLAEAPRVYQVCIACAVFLQVLLCAAAYRALHSPGRSRLWLAFGGLALGLAMAARPTYIAGAFALAVPVGALARRAEPGRRLASAASNALWAFLPPFACGLAILWFNRERFGAPLEFGVRYQLAAERVTNLVTMSPRFLPGNVLTYFFAPGRWDSYFPFFTEPGGKPVGILRYCPWAWLALLAPFLARSREAGRAAIIWTLVAAAAGNFSLLACFYSTTNRYPSDFAAPLLILAGVGALAFGERMARAGRERAARWIVYAAASVSLFFGLASYFGAFPDELAFTSLSRVANWPGYALEKARGNGPGGLRLALDLPERTDGPQKLIETGREIRERDQVDVELLPGGKGRLYFVHEGTRPVASRDFAVPGDRRIVVEARFGSLLPPFGHPAFAAWTLARCEAERRVVRLTVDGTDILRTSADCYPASPASTRLGTLAWGEGPAEKAFSGTIETVERLPFPAPPTEVAIADPAQPIELSLYLPPGGRTGPDPLVATGSLREGDLLYCVRVGADRVGFALDHYGMGGPRSRAVHVDPLTVHRVQVWMGSFAGAASAGRPPADRLIVGLDGKVVLNIHQSFFPKGSAKALIGTNLGGSSESGPVYDGEILGAAQIPASALPEALWAGGYGSVDMTVDFPRAVEGTHEPLVVTGAAGAGDFIYVSYVDPTHVAFGFDHWAVGGIAGAPVEVDVSRPHALSILMASLYPEGDRAHASKRVRVTLDGKVVLEGESPCYPSGPDQVSIASNRIGGSTCGPFFTGNVEEISRSAEPRQ